MKTAKIPLKPTSKSKQVATPVEEARKIKSQVRKRLDAQLAMRGLSLDGNSVPHPDIRPGTLVGPLPSVMPIPMTQSLVPQDREIETVTRTVKNVKLKLVQIAGGPAVDRLEKIIKYSKNDSAAVSAIKDVLDRVGLKTVDKIKLESDGYSAELLGKLSVEELVQLRETLRKVNKPIIEAEVVESTNAENS